MTLHTGDCLEVVRTLPDASVDAVVTDPPYNLAFMGRRWDAHPSPATFMAWCEAWGREALRVTVPGGYLLAFGGTRTHHRLVCGLEDAGWIIRDELDWVYASGFPKGKANLKPAHEPIVLARKPGPLRELGIDACRIGTDTARGDRYNGKGPGGAIYRGDGPPQRPLDEPWEVAAGRWPANVILTDPVFDGGVDGVVGGGEARDAESRLRDSAENDGGLQAEGWGTRKRMTVRGYDDSGTYSRFFLIPKADRGGREPVLRGQIAAIETRTHGDRAQGSLPQQTPQASVLRENGHPTVKPIELMRHLVRLVTPTGGTVLDPFLGSGTTAIACEMEGFAWIGIEKEPEYVAIAEARLNGVQRGLGLDVPAPTRKRAPSSPEELE